MSPAGPPDPLVLRITEDDTSGYRVELLDGQSGPIAAGTLGPALPPFGAVGTGPPEEQIRQAVLGAYTPGAGRIAEIGRYLFGLLAAGGVADAWQQARAAAADRSTMLDIRVRALARLPWELLTDAGLPVVLPSGGGLIHGRFPFAEAPEPVESPLRVLVVVGSAKPELTAEAEVAAIQRALAACPWRAHTEVLVEPSSAEFYERVGELRPHVFHFIGHGRHSPGTDTPVLELTDAGTGETWTVSATDIRSGLLAWTPRIMVLNACRTAEVAAQSEVCDIAEACVLAKVPAVVCMQGLVESAAGVAFSDGFYRALNAGERVDIAVAAARLGISHKLGLQQRDWALPVLYMQVAPADVLPFTCALTDKERVSLEQVPEFTEVRRLVDRDLQRRDMWWTMDPPWDGSPKGLVAVTGAVAAGRTRLVYSSLLNCAGRGHQVRYVDLGRARRMSWIEVLYAIRDGDPSAGSPLQAALPPGPFAEFNREIVRLAAGQEPQDGDQEPGTPPRPAFTAETEHAPVYARRIADRFGEALRRAATGRPLTVAIDHLGGVGQGGVVDGQVTSYLSPLLFGAAVRGELSPLRLIVVLREDECDLLGQDVRQLMHEVRVPGFQRRLYPFLQREHFARVGHKDDSWSQFEDLLDAMGGLISGDWYPERLSLFDNVVRTVLT